MEKSGYCNYGMSCNGCFLCVNCYNLVDSCYSTSCWSNDGVSAVYNVLDCDDCSDSSFIYQSCNLKKSYKCFYSHFLEECSDCYYSYELQSCSHCLGCVNLSGKKYHILNQEVTSDEFERQLQFLLSSEKAQKIFQKKLKTLQATALHRAFHISMSENSTGDFILASKNVLSSFSVISTENCKYSYTSGYLTKNMYDGMNAGGESDTLYEAQHSHFEYHSAFLLDVDRCENTYLCELCYSCKFCFGCVGLRNKSYCILNKQYTEDEYEKLVPQIIEHMMKTGEWGEFFPSSISPFGYNETVANEYFPLNLENVIPAKAGIYEKGKIPLNDSETSSEGQKEKEIFSSPDSFSESGLKKGKTFNWSTYEAPFPKVEKIIPASKLPDDISKIPDDILNWAIECEATKKPFRIIREELEFYRKHNLPIPRRHPDQRHLDRMALRNPRKLFERKCDKCGKIIKTTYAPEKPEIVYCENCYNKEIYQAFISDARE